MTYKDSYYLFACFLNSVKFIGYEEKYHVLTGWLDHKNHNVKSNKNERLALFVNDPWLAIAFNTEYLIKEFNLKGIVTKEA